MALECLRGTFVCISVERMNCIKSGNDADVHDSQQKDKKERGFVGMLVILNHC